MQDKFDDLMYQAGLTAQGSWDDMDKYDRAAIMKFAELIVKECINKIEDAAGDSPELYGVALDLMDHFGLDDPLK